MLWSLRCPSEDRVAGAGWLWPVMTRLRGTPWWLLKRFLEESGNWLVGVIAGYAPIRPIAAWANGLSLSHGIEYQPVAR
jgi:hypothetical protein